MNLQISRRTAWTIFVVLVLLLLAGTTMPSEVKASLENRIWRKVPWGGLAHYTLFALIAMCPVYGGGTSGVWRAICVGVVLAALTESLQSLVPGRNPQFKDVAIDLGGTATALLLRKMLPPARISA